jgi:2-dehydropantoate 2-reductase
MSNRLKVAVVGAGAMGCAYGGRLSEGGHEVWFVDVWEEHVEAMNEAGLRIEGVGGDRITRVRATTNPADVGVVDLVLIAVKSWATRDAVQSAKPLIGANTVVMTVQNGLGNVPTIAEAVGPERVVGGIALESGVIKGPGHLCHTSSTQTQIADLVGGRTPRVEHLAQLFNAAGIKTVVADNIDTVIWGKLLLNVTVNSLCSVTGFTCSELPQYEGTASLLKLVITEAAGVAKALDVKIPYEDPVDRVFRNCIEVGPAKPSMLQDLEKGRQTEIDFMNGAIVREAERLGLQAPYNTVLTFLVKALEQSGVRKGKPLGGNKP